MNVIENIDSEIEVLSEQIKLLQEKKYKLAQLTQSQQLAIFLHEINCKWNHTDGCDWYYGCDDNQIPKWNSEIQKRYLKQAQTLLYSYEYNVIVDIVRKLHEF